MELDDNYLNQSNFRNFYEDYYKDIKKPNPAYLIYDNIRAITIKQMITVGLGRNLIIGCGDKRDVDIFSDESIVFGFDFSWYAIKRIKHQKMSRYNIFLIVADALSIPYPANYFDVIVCSEVLEHIPHIDKAIKEMFRVIKPNGHLVVSSPNWQSLFGLSRWLYEKLTGESFHTSGQPYDDWKTLRKYKDSLEPYFKVQEVRGVWYLPPLHIGDRGVPASITNLIYKIYSPVEKVLSRKLSWLGHLIILKCSPAPNLK